jgi:hypothetical protein
VLIARGSPCSRFQMDSFACALDPGVASEAKYRKSTPIYFATDIAVVNKDLEVISSSYWKWKRLKPSMMGKLSQSLICVPIQGMASGTRRSRHPAAHGSGALEVANQPLSDDVRHECVRVMLALATLEPQGESERCGEPASRTTRRKDAKQA